jgi:hypothetical protein
MTLIPLWLSNQITRSVKQVMRFRRDLCKARTIKEEKHLERELKQAQIDAAYAQHWVMLS